MLTFVILAKSSMTLNQRRGNVDECELLVYLGLVWIPRHDFYISVHSITSNALLTKHRAVQWHYIEKLSNDTVPNHT